MQQALGRAGRRAAGRWELGRTSGRAADARGACGRQERGARAAGRGSGEAGARGARGLPTGCALGALDLFSIRFDSILFMSRFLDIVREPGS